MAIGFTTPDTTTRRTLGSPRRLSTVELAGTVKVNIGVGENAILPGLQVFADVLVPRLSSGEVIAEFTRLAARLSLSSVHPELAYVIMRPAFMAAEHFDADCAVGSPRAEHIAFYRRAFGATLWRPPRDYPGLTAKLACVGADYRSARQFIETRYPFFKSDPAEREALFGPRKVGSNRAEGGEDLGAALVSLGPATRPTRVRGGGLALRAERRRPAKPRSDAFCARRTSSRNRRGRPFPDSPRRRPARGP